MFSIYDGREAFFQWDLNQKLVIEKHCDMVHFAMGDTVLATEVKELMGEYVAEVPNIMLQNAGQLTVYACVEGEGAEPSYTRALAYIRIVARPKPVDYVYTETEVKTWEELERNVREAVAAANEAVRIASSITDGKDGEVGPQGPEGPQGPQGIPGESLTVVEYFPGTASGADNIIKLSDGTILRIKNGAKGADGTSVTVKSVIMSSEDGGENIVKFSDDKQVIIKNGTKGATGKNAFEYAVEKGYTGTEEDFAEKMAIEEEWYATASDKIVYVPMLSATVFHDSDPISLTYEDFEDIRTVTVNCDGTNYERGVVIQENNGNSFIHLGSIPDGDPFEIVVSTLAGFSVIYLDSGENTHTISVTGHKSVPNKIPRKFLPDDLVTGEGIGIESIEQTVTSTEDGGENIITATLTDGTKSEFVIRNGSKGSDGEGGGSGNSNAFVTKEPDGAVLTEEFSATSSMYSNKLNYEDVQKYNKVRVIYDGTVYDCVPSYHHDNSAGYDEYWYNIGYNSDYSNDEPFNFMCYKGTKILTLNFKNGGTHTVSVTGLEGVYNKLPIECLPEGYPYKEVSYGTILDNVTFVNTGDGQCLYEGEILSFIPGEEYAVTIDGTVYTVVAWEIDMGGMVITGLGNRVSIGFEDSGEPFLIFGHEIFGGTMCAIPDPDAESITVKIEGKRETVTKLDPKFIPDEANGIYVIKNVMTFEELEAELGDSSGMNKTINNKFEELLPQARAGRFFVFEFVEQGIVKHRYSQIESQFQDAGEQAYISIDILFRGHTVSFSATNVSD